MTAHRVFVPSAGVVLAAALVAGCASTEPVARNDRVAPRSLAGVFTIQMAALRPFRDVEPARPPIEAPHTAVPADASDTSVCRTAPPATGSRIGTRTMCMTGNEWDAKTQNDRDQLNDAESRALASSPYAPF